MSFWSIFFGFTLGILFLVVGGMALWTGLWIGLFLLAIALFLLPPVRLLVHHRTGRSITPAMRTFIITVLLALFVLSMPYVTSDLAEQAENQPASTDAEPGS